jgi:hypothetical protein
VSIMATVAMTESWVIEENVITEELVLRVRGENAGYEARNGECAVHLSASVISAIRGLSAKQVPHLRKARKEVFSERSRKGWVTRRSEREDRLVLEDAGVVGDPVVQTVDEAYAGPWIA